MFFNVIKNAETAEIDTEWRLMVWDENEKPIVNKNFTHTYKVNEGWGTVLAETTGTHVTCGIHIKKWEIKKISAK